ncbi:MAG: TAT-variant-translocated molybdopterin oxidoreductase [candidate division Zixibacteria bacterium]|nr:TAT-variant-translocated molybdopterin oxidoreductase [candidate division Zixibacteria bacterium]
MKENILEKTDSLVKERGRGREYWRSLDDLADTPEFKEFLEREFPQGAAEFSDPISRRGFLSIMGASVALAGLSSCRRPVQKILPYVTVPDDLTIGNPEHYATNMPFGLGALGVVVESHEGRPTKIEGNKLHSSTQGRSNIFMQASILDLYDPDRSRAVRGPGGESAWEDFVRFWVSARNGYRDTKGDGLAVICESFRSPTLARLKAEFLKTFPKAKWVTYEPISDERIYDGIELATGDALQPIYSFENAEVILSLESDFLMTEGESIRNSGGFASARRVENENGSMNRLYVVESSYSTTGTMADHRIRLRSSDVHSFTTALAHELIDQGVNIPSAKSAPRTTAGFDSAWLAAVASDLKKAGAKSLVIAGRRQAPETHALVVAINAALKNTNSTVSYVSLTDSSRSDLGAFGELVSDMNNGQIKTLFILGGNPVYNAPVDFDFESALENVSNSVHLSSHNDETSKLCSWHVPRAHYLESWGDVRSYDGSLGICQPLIEPLFGGKSDTEMFSLLATGDSKSGYDVVRDTIKNEVGSIGFENNWRRILHDGLYDGSAYSSTTPSINHSRISAALKKSSAGSTSAAANNLEVVFVSSNTLDGRLANNGWLQELPDSLTKLTWDNAAVISYQTAQELGLKNGDMARLSLGDRELEMPVWIGPGQADYTVMLALGYGRKDIGRVADGVGFDTYKLRSSSAPYFESGASLSKTGESYPLSSSQDHGAMEGRALLLEKTLDEYRQNPHFASEMTETPPLNSLWTEHEYSDKYQWGMAIDLNSCTGCNACVIACQSENNVPIVGKEQVAKGREMHWIRIDRYFSGDVENPQVSHQPVACQHCEMAPCEQVCPVNATMHDKEGLNVMVYNRCIGTRYCSNNCPYKVRRFNYFNLTKDTPEVVKMAMNPEVTVRSRGVMEKCTYCIQRITKAKSTAKLEERDVRDSDFETACQQSCPADAIVFGNIADPNSKVSKVKARNLNYSMLAEFNTRPRTTYQARLKNPNPKLPLTAAAG